MRKKVVLVGNYPPPLGGISVHIQRLSRLLSPSWDVAVIDLYGSRSTPTCAGEKVFRVGGPLPASFWRGFQLIRALRGDVVHFHVTYLKRFAWVGPAMISAAGSRASKILTIHGGSFVAHLRQMGAFRRGVVRKVLESVDKIIAVNEEASSALAELGLASKVVVIPAYLPAEEGASDVIDQQIAKLSGRKLVSACGSGFSYYGLHVLLDAMEMGSLRQHAVPVLSLYGRCDERYVENLIRRTQGLDGIIFRDLPPAEFAYLLSRSDIFVRPTDRDGDSVAVREAIERRCQVIASDCAPRPKGVLLFPTDNVAALAQGLNAAMRDPQVGMVPIQQPSTAEILRVYTELLH